ncbi:DUF559 domain-containing protein [Roseivirga pacifica]|uniref:DUF559 domain-containing protein n=1 Tax=Roseivirga pacifica TaxID=1267423 RepID=UPI00227B767A|nr:DUF559 domain-containing protein [Roseivirga pacifica]
MKENDIEILINKLYERIKGDHNDYFNSGSFDRLFEYIEDFINDDSKSILEKAFFLILHQFPTDNKDYIVMPNERVLIDNIYDQTISSIEYEVDFALYGGSISNPVKVAIECDGLRSHGAKNAKRDRRKEVNLQADGWIVMRFRSKEIQQELNKFIEDEFYTSDFLYSIETTIQKRLKIINHHSYFIPEYRSKLTGYRWGKVTCPNCNFNQFDILNHKRITCRSCNERFTRKVLNTEQVIHEKNGILNFESDK